jgi:hypothetical protein
LEYLHTSHYPSAETKQNYQISRRNFINTVQRTKKQYHKNYLDTITTHQPNKAAKKAKPSDYSLPTLERNNIIAETNPEKANLLRQALFIPPHPASITDIKRHSPYPQPTEWPTLMDAELEQAIK